MSCKALYRKALYLLIVSIAVLNFGCGEKTQPSAIQQGNHIDLYVDAVVLREQNQDQQAIEKLNESLKANDSFSLAWSMLGEIYQDIKEYRNSAYAYEKATELNPYSFKDYLNLGNVYYTLERFASAVNAYTRAVEIEPDNTAANLGAAKSYYKLEDYTSALEYGQRAQQLDPEMVEPLKLIGDIYTSQEETDQAIATYKRVLELDSEDSDAMVSLAVAYNTSKRYQAAKDLLTEVIAKDPENAIAQRNLGYANLWLDMPDEAIANYQNAVELNPRDWNAMRGLGVAYILKAKKQGDGMAAEYKQKAVALWQRSLEINPDQPKSEYLLKLIRFYSKS